MSTSCPSLLQTCLVLVLLLCILVCNDVTANPIAVAAKKRGKPRRYPRARYRVGYIFGKRSSADTHTSSRIFDLVSRQLISRKDLAGLIQTSPDISNEVVSLLDKNNDGYITVSDFL